MQGTTDIAGNVTWGVNPHPEITQEINRVVGRGLTSPDDVSSLLSDVDPGAFDDTTGAEFQMSLATPLETAKMSPTDVMGAYLAGAQGIDPAAQAAVRGMQGRLQAQYTLQDPFGENVAGRPGFLNFLQTGGALTGQNLMNRLRTTAGLLKDTASPANAATFANQTLAALGRDGDQASKARAQAALRAQFIGNQGLQQSAANLPYQQAGYAPVVTNAMAALMQGGYQRQLMNNPWQQYLPWAMEADPGMYTALG